MGKNEKDKKKYEAPVVVPLGELARAMSQQSCKTGTGAHGSCNNGGVANAGEGGCGNGNSPGSVCNTGCALTGCAAGY